ncbi:hypothetical protein JOE31_002883 [Arthrobacter sp. PvP023]|uniref:hypothetical protein n=1 Tax=Micrococcaceae TaxID=1268 RepID=UPI001AE1061B|nr:hypothetical protein [Arthrobacter sp. PvP023]MBP1136651.1 hypothetical protein [Arthrobacter sp. PvP023]
MEDQIVTVADLVGAIIVEMERRNYKPSVITQYRIVWDKLCRHSGAMPADAFSVEHGMDFLEDVLHIRSHPLSEATSYRWMKAIYLLSDFKRTGVLTLRKPGREFVFSGAAAAPFQAYVASAGDSPSRLIAALVHFTPGARTNWHSHPLGQTLHCTEGAGIVATRDGTVILMRPGGCQIDCVGGM